MPDRAKYVKGSVEERFWPKVTKSDGCWEWQGYCLRGGAGTLRVGNRSLYAARISYEMAYGPIPEGMLVCHKCDNPKCVRPDHLFVGTHADNNKDRAAKGRSVKELPSIRGDAHWTRRYPEAAHKKALKAWETRRKNMGMGKSNE